MELSSTVFRDILGPLATFKAVKSGGSESTGDGDAPAREARGHMTTCPSASQQRLPTSEDSKIPPPLFSSILSVTQPHTFPTYNWTIQGADPDARRFFAIPQFALDGPPLRVDVYLPPLEDYHPEVRSLLRPEEVIYCRGEEISSLGISRWLAAVLEQWCIEYDSSPPRTKSATSKNEGKFQRDYNSMPFGSRILVTVGGLSRSADGGTTIDHEIYLIPDYDVEQGMMTVESLREMWGADGDDSHWPEVIDLNDLRLKRQFHEAISVVTISPSPDHSYLPSGCSSRSKNGEMERDGGRQPESYPQDGGGKEWIFKSLTRDQRYLYNELKMLLSLGPSHENIIPPPRYIVTKRGRFGGRRGVCGFVLEYFGEGSLKQFLLGPSSLRISFPSRLWSRCSCSSSAQEMGTLISPEQKILWAKQITRSLIHINNSKRQGDGDDSSFGFGFYPDLKPDNIMLRPSPSPSPLSTTPPSMPSQRGRDSITSEHYGKVTLYDAVLIDLEQRGGWFSWSPPEISYLEYLETILEADVPPGEIDDSASQGFDVGQLEEVQEEVGQLLREYYSICFTSPPTGSQPNQSAAAPDNSACSSVQAAPGSTTGWNVHHSGGHNRRTENKYYNSPGGFSTAWLALLAKRNAAPKMTACSSRIDGPADDDGGSFDLERAQVFMLGKLLWCIFEEEAVMRCGIDHEMLSDGDADTGYIGRRTENGKEEKRERKKVFPEFEYTPCELRGLIKKCTAGAGEWEEGSPTGWRIVLNGEGKLVPACALGNRYGRDSGGGEETVSDGYGNGDGIGSRDEQMGKVTGGVLTADDTQREATKYWREEIQKAIAFVGDMIAYEKRRRGQRPSSSGTGGHWQLDHNGGKGIPCLLSQARSRPLLGQVLEELDRMFG